MKLVTYSELALLCGKNKAYEALLVIERSAKIKTNKIVVFDCEKRLRSALAAMNNTQIAA